MDEIKLSVMVNKELYELLKKERKKTGRTIKWIVDTMLKEYFFGNKEEKEYKGGV